MLQDYSASHTARRRRCYVNVTLLRKFDWEFRCIQRAFHSMSRSVLPSIHGLHSDETFRLCEATECKVDLLCGSALWHIPFTLTDPSVLICHTRVLRSNSSADQLQEWYQIPSLCIPLLDKTKLMGEESRIRYPIVRKIEAHRWTGVKISWTTWRTRTNSF